MGWFLKRKKFALTGLFPKDFFDLNLFDRIMKIKTCVLTWNLLVIWSLVSSAQAQVIYSTAGSTYSQNFDTLASSGASLPWINDSTLPGWLLYRQPAPGTDITTYAAGTGSSGTGSFYSFGATGSAERALGGVGSGGTYFGSPANGAVAGWIAVGFVNNTGQTLKQFSVNYTGEQWRDGGVTAAQTMRFEYGWGGSFTTVGAWTAPGSAFDWASPVVSGSAGAVDGNTSGRVLGRGGVISGLNWAPGETLWLRWVEVNDPGNDHGLAIDDFNFVAAVPEPVGVATWTGLGLLLLALIQRAPRKGSSKLMLGTGFKESVRSVILNF